MSQTFSFLFLTRFCFSLSSLYTFIGQVGLLFFLASHLLWDEDTYGEVSALGAVLVLHQDAVLAGVGRVDASDGEAGELARLELEDAVLVGCDLLVVLQPCDLRHWVARDVAGEVESLVERRTSRAAVSAFKFVKDAILCVCARARAALYLALLNGDNIRKASCHTSTT